MKNWFYFLVSLSFIVFSLSTFAVEDHQTSAYGRIVVFGDSLSDVGTYGAVSAPIGGGKFTTNPGKLWVEVIGTQLGLEVKPKRQEGFGFPIRDLGGFNYAQGGARVVAGKVVKAADGEAPSASARPVAEQAEMFLQEHKTFKSNDLVLIQGGANDIFAQLSSLKAGKIKPEDAVKNMVQVAIELSMIIGNLKTNGAQKLVVVNLPAVEQTPKMISLDPQIQQLVKLMVTSFNAALAQKMTDMNVTVVDLYNFDLEFNANYEKLGFKSISKPACKTNVLPTGSSLFCTSKRLVEPGADLTYKFADDIHPATGYSKVAGEFIFAEMTK